MEPQKPGNSPGSGPEVVKRQRVAKQSAAQRVGSWTVQNEMRGVLGRVSTGAARRVLDSANPREVRIYKKAVSIAAKTREDTASMTREHKCLSGNRGNLWVKIFGRDSTPPVRDKTRVDTRDKRREATRDCGGRK